MKKFLLAATAVAALAAIDTAYAADLALKAPPAPPAYSWTGWYAGVNIGGSFGQARDTASYGAPAVPFTTASTSADLDGVIGGGQIGYNLQSGSWLFGLEADIQGSSERASALRTGGPITIAGAAVTVLTAALNDQEKLPWFGTVRGRLGLLASPTWLFYVTGGLAYGEIKSTELLTVTAASPGGTATAALSSGSNTTRTGWTLGGGVEGVISGNWTAKIEYLYMDFGTFNTAATGLGIFAPVNLSTHVTDNVVRVGLNYHFH